MKVTEIIAQAKESGKPRFSFELLPPLKGDGLNKIYQAIDSLMPWCVAVLALLACVLPSDRSMASRWCLTLSVAV